MIVSYSKNFIFIKTKKTAGSTVEAVLAAGCGPEDIVTLKTTKGGYDRGPQNTGEVFHTHMTAEMAYPHIDRTFWDGALKLTVERHPYEKAVSQAYYRLGKKNKDGQGFPEFLDDIVRNGDYTGFWRWSINGKVAVDEFIKQENLRADLERVGARLGIPIPEELPQLKTRTRTNRAPAREILTAEQMRIVYERCEHEFKILGWER